MQQPPGVLASSPYSDLSYGQLTSQSVLHLTLQSVVVQAIAYSLEFRLQSEWLGCNCASGTMIQRALCSSNALDRGTSSLTIREALTGLHSSSRDPGDFSTLECWVLRAMIFFVTHVLKSVLWSVYNPRTDAPPPKRPRGRCKTTSQLNHNCQGSGVRGRHSQTEAPSPSTHVTFRRDVPTEETHAKEAPASKLSTST